MRKSHREAGKARRAEKPKEAGALRAQPLRIDYRVYALSKKEWANCILIYLALDFVISLLFFNSWIPFLLLAPGFFLYVLEEKERLLAKRSRQMQKEFLDGIQMTATCLQAGYSVENAFREAGKELRKLYDRDSFIIREFQLLRAQMDRNEPIEGLLLDLGRRSGVEDIQSFAEVFLTAKRSGGDLLAIIRNTVSCIRQKEETMEEIETCLAGKVMEQNIMSLVPILILAYVRLGSPEFVDGLYGNVVGVTVMILCFLVYVAAFLWGRSIVRIEV